MKDNPTILITGSAGLIGSTLYQHFLNQNIRVVGIDNKPSDTVDNVVDVSDRAALHQILTELSPTCIIHAAAIKGLVDCETDREVSWNTNVGSTLEIVQYAHTHGTKIVYISSDVVFDGQRGNYTETDLPNPINWYGTTKYMSELALGKIPNVAICRTALVVGDLLPHQRDELQREIGNDVLQNQSLFPYYVAERLWAGLPVAVPETIVSSPTHVSLLVHLIDTILNRDLVGTFHCVGSEQISRYTFAKKIAEYLGHDTNLVIADEKNIASIRPKSIGLNVDESYRLFGLSHAQGSTTSLLEHLIFRA